MRALSLRVVWLFLAALPVSIFAQTWEQDTLAVRITLNDNGFFDIPISKVVTRVNDRVQGLRLDSLPIQSLGFEIFNLDSLKTVSLVHCGLKSIPPTISQWVSVTSLNLSENSLSDLPQELGDLSKLSQLSLRSNAFSVFPSGVLRLRSLLYLDIGNNLISALPANIDTLANLAYLFADQDSLSGVPESIAFLPFLKTLNLSGNQLVQVPFSIAAMDSLESLDLSINQLSTLPGEFVLLTHLKSLDISSNQLCGLSPAVVEWADAKQAGWLASQHCAAIDGQLAVRGRSFLTKERIANRDGIWVSRDFLGRPIEAMLFNSVGQVGEQVTFRPQLEKGQAGWWFEIPTESNANHYLKISTVSGVKLLSVR